LPKTPELPAPQRRLGEVCAPGYTGRKRGEVDLLDKVDTLINVCFSQISL
jgi:hypothetical protein